MYINIYIFIHTHIYKCVARLACTPCCAPKQYWYNPQTSETTWDAPSATSPALAGSQNSLHHSCIRDWTPSRVTCPIHMWLV